MMKILSLIKGKTLIITKNSYKKQILMNMNKCNCLYDVKFMSIEEYKKKLVFDYDIHAINYLVKKYQIKVNNAISLINNLYYINDKQYKSSKLCYLVNIKKELDDNNLLIYNPYFIKYLDKVKVIVYGYDDLDKYTLSLFENAIFINEDIIDKKIKIYEFSGIIDEVEFVFNEISNLLIKNIDINHIKLCNISSEYIPYLKRFSKYYGYDIELPTSSIYGTKMVNDFLMMVTNNYSKEIILDRLLTFSDSKLASSIINLMNKYCDFDNLNDVYDLLVNDLKNTKINKSNYKNVIKIVDLFDYIADDDYVFLLGFNNGNIPKLLKDEDYITDNIKNEVIMSDTNELNYFSNQNTLKALKRINNLWISYKLKTPFNTYFPSNLIDELDAEIIKKDYNSFSYSLSYNRIKYAIMLDDYIKYGESNKELGKLYHNYGTMNYATFDNKYKGINKDSLLKYLNNKLTLSYSSIDYFYKCQFRYYLNNILKIEPFEETFDTIIGNVAHYILRKAFTESFDFQREFAYAIKDYQFNNMEKFFINKLADDLFFVIKTIKEYQINTGLNQELYEQQISVSLEKKPEVEFKGFIDKLIYRKKDNATYLAIIDYKTGKPSINLDYLKYGLSMQLPSYLYLTKNSNLFSNIKYCGFYLQHILSSEIKSSDDKNYEEQKRDLLKLQGYSTSDLNRLALLDDSYENSMMIKGMKTKKDGSLMHTAKVLDDFEIEEIINLCENKIKESFNEILNGHFTINPKIIKGENVGCQYCNFQDICFHKEQDNVYLESEVE